MRGNGYKRPQEVILLSACLKSFVFSTLFDLTLVVITLHIECKLIED